MTSPTPADTAGVLLMGYGSPNGSQDLLGYLTEVLHGRRPSEEMVAE